MKAWVLEGHGDPAKVLALREAAAPVPATGQLLIQCEGFGLNFADVMAVRGLYRDAPPPPCVLGYEVVGRVIGAGPSVTDPPIGKRVIALTRFGGYAEQAVTDHRAIAEVPDDLGIGEACALATQGVTAWHLAHRAAPMHKGERVLVHSAAGGVGQLLVQLAVRQGCEVFAVASGADKMQFLRSLGAHQVIDRTRADYAAAIRFILGTARLDVSYNAVGGSNYRKDMKLLGSGGRLVLFGGAARASGGKGIFSTLQFIWQMGLVVPIFLVMRSKAIIGVNLLRLSEHRPEWVAECLRSTVAAYGEGYLRPHVHEVFPHDRLTDAHSALASGRTIGKVAVRW